MVLDIPDNMYRSITANTLQPNQSLASVNEAAMMALSQQGNRNLKLCCFDGTGCSTTTNASTCSD